MPTLFVSDTHLAAARPAQIEVFRQVLARAGAAGAALYVLGDLVEFWLGDDDDDPVQREVVGLLAAYTAQGNALHVAFGNRDFLLGERFKAETGASLLEDWTTVQLGGETALLTHGDLLCTRDLKYQMFRSFVRNPANQQKFLASPLEERRRIASSTREGTQASMMEKDDHIMDVDQDAVERMMTSHDATVLIHGHTHRPGTHAFTLNGRTCHRHVLGDWYGTGTVLWVDGSEFRLQSVPEFLA